MSELFEEVLILYRAGHKEYAAWRIRDILFVDPGNDRAWMWLAACVEATDEKRYCLYRAGEVNPDNMPARQAFLDLGNGAMRRPVVLDPAAKPPPAPTPAGTPAGAPPQQVNEVSEAILREACGLANALARDPLALGRWLGYGRALRDQLER